MRTIFCFVGLFSSLAAAGQTPLTPEWVITKTSPQGEQAFGWGVDADAQNRVWWCPSLTNNGLRIYCYGFDVQGAEIWPQPLEIGSAGEFYQAFTVEAKSDHLYVGGRHCPFAINTCEQLLVQVDKTAGQPLWSKTWGAEGYDELDGLAARPGDGLYTGGWWGPDAGALYDADIALRRLDFDGNTVWAAQHGAPGTAEHQDGQFVVDDDFIFACGMVGGTGFFNLYEGRSYLAKFSKTDGSLVDSVQFGGQNWWLDWNNALGMTTDGTALYLTGVTSVAPNDNQIFVAKYAKNLDLLWYNTWGGPATETARAIGVHNGQVYVGGAANSPELASNGAYDACLLRFDATDGALLAARIWGDARDNEIRDLTVADDAVFASGTSAVDLFGPTHTEMEAFLLRENLTDLVDAEAPTGGAGGFSISPNPARDHLEIRTQGLGGPTMVSLFDCWGKQVFLKNENVDGGAGLIRVNLPPLPAGVYGCRVWSGDFLGSRLLLIR